MVNTYRRIIVILEEPWQQIVNRCELPPLLSRASSSHWSRFCALPGQVDDARPSAGDLASPSLRWSARGACELLCIAYTCPRRDGAGQLTLANDDLMLTSPLRFHSGAGEL